MFLENINELAHFDEAGHLTVKGKKDMWSEIINHICLFDAEEIHLQPRPRKPIKGTGDEGDNSKNYR